MKLFATYFIKFEVSLFSTQTEKTCYVYSANASTEHWFREGKRKSGRYLIRCQVNLIFIICYVLEFRRLILSEVVSFGLKKVIAIYVRQKLKLKLHTKLSLFLIISLDLFSPWPTHNCPSECAILQDWLKSHQESLLPKLLKSFQFLETGDAF